MSIRRALITGSSSGIGAATAEALANQGYAVWLTYTSGDEAVRRVAASCEAAGSPDVRISRLDLRSPESIDALLAELTDQWGELHVLVNNGGVCPYIDFEDITVDGWDAVMETNGRGTFLLSRGSLPLLRAAESNAPDTDRVIINLSSIAGQVGAIKTGLHYAASKGAILAMTRSFARLLAPERIRVNAVTPGPVVSGITDNLSEDARAALEASIPLGRFGQPEDVAWIIASLAAPQARFITGVTYDANGGVRID